MQSVAFLSFVLLGSYLFLTYSSYAEASPLNSNELFQNGDEGKISVAFLRFLENLQEDLEARRELMAAGAKRGLDLGMGRGFSGSQAVKHMMGLEAANYAGGPGRRRRSLDLKH